MPVSSRKKIIELCRELRRNATAEEKLLWANLRRKKIGGRKFYRQHPITYQATNDLYYFFIADFYCANKQLVIEVDGPIHKQQKDYDEGRTEVLNGLGLKVMRFTNDEVSTDISDVLQRIRAAVED